MIKKTKLPDDILSRIERLQSLFEQDRRVMFAYIFGGAAKAALKPLSDLDIAVYLGPWLDQREVKPDLYGAIADTLGTDEIDLVVLNDAPLSLAGRILADRKIVIDKEPFLRHAFESRIMREFFDFRRKEYDILSRRFA